MRIGITGLPNSGKTTIFNALTRSDSETAAFSSGRLEVHTATVQVPDPRVDRLAALFNPRKVTSAQVLYSDIAGLAAGSGRGGISGALLNAMSASDALMLVARGFEDESVPHPQDRVDPGQDLFAMESEFILNDMALIESRLCRLAGQKSRGTTQERQRLEQERELLERLLAVLEEETPLRRVELSLEEKKRLGGFGLLSLKPILRVINIGDEAEQETFCHLTGEGTLLLRGRLESEIAQMDPAEADDFLHDYGIEEPGLNRAIRTCYTLLGLHSFFTVGEDEVRAWTVARGATAPEAAGVIHSDLQKGFIRAETVAYADLMDAGSMAEARRMGKVRLEGKEYVVRDGDIMNIRFAV